MAKIETYVLASSPLSFSDMLIGTEIDGPIPNATKNFSLQELYGLFSTMPITGNLQQVLDTGNTATQDIVLAGDITSTTITPLYIVDMLASTGAVGEVLMRAVGGISWAPLTTPTLQEVLNSGSSATSNMSLVGNLTVTKAIPGDIQDGLGNTGTTGQVLYKSSTGLLWANLPVVTPVGLQDVLDVGWTATANIILTGTITSTNIKPSSITDELNVTGTSGQVLTRSATGIRWDNPTSGSVNSVTASTPLSSSGGTNPNITIQQSTASQSGYLSSTDWTAFSNKPSGSGSPNMVAVWGLSGLTTGLIYDDGNNVEIGGGLVNTNYVLNVNGDIASHNDIAINTNNGSKLRFVDTYLNTDSKAYITALSGSTFYDLGFFTNNIERLRILDTGVLKVSNLGGTGTRMVVANSTGELSTQAIPTGGGGISHGTASGTDTYTVTISGVTSYADGDSYLVRFTNGNTTGCTLNINSIGAVTLYRNNDGPLIGGDIVAGGEMLCVYNSTLVGFQCIGTAPNTLLGYVTNGESTTITKGQAVYAYSGTGDRMVVKLAYNTGDATSAQTVGIVLSSSIAANQKGLIMVQGLLDGLSILPTSTWADGSPVYLGSTPGAITNVKPYAPNHLVYLGVVTTASNGAAGRMYVRVQNGYELDELHNVQAQSPTVNDVLYYFGGSPGQWKTASISTVLGYTPQAQLTNPVTGTGTNNEIAYFNTTGSNIGSLPTATYPSLTELSYVKGVTSDIQTQINSKFPTSSYEWMFASGLQALGSTIKGINLGTPSFYSLGSAAVLTNTAVRFVPYYLANPTTITGVKFYQGNIASYVGNNYNGVGLYSYSNGILTLVASTTNAASFWINTINTWVTKAFSSPYSASSGVYYIGMMYSYSSQTTAPQTLAGSTVNANFATIDFANTPNGTPKIAGVSATGLTTLPSPTINSSSINTTTNVPLIYLY